MLVLKNGKIRERIKEMGYGYYAEPSSLHRLKKSFHHTGINCSDEVVPGINERRRKMLKLMKITEYTDFTETYSRIVQEMHEILLEETMLFLDCSEQQAKLWIGKYVDFNKVYLSEKDGRKYMQVTPVLMKKY